jgi:hypothetical protein
MKMPSLVTSYELKSKKVLWHWFLASILPTIKAFEVKGIFVL